MPNDSTLQLISNEAKSSIDQMKIVTPSMYASIFSQYAKEHNEVIEDEHNLSTSLLQLECSNLTNLQTEASRSTQQLTDSTTKAINAIKAKDEKSLAEVLEETTKLRSEIEKLKEAVYKDELTHAYNRKWLNDHYIDKETDALNAKGVLAIIDLNYFKQVNDTHGHIIGDKVLIFIANQLKTTRANVIRYGGDEFIIMFESNNSIKYATDNLEKIRESIISKKLKANETKFTVSFSYGLVLYEKGDNLAQTIELADKNMYNDKIQIKKRVTGI